jgi:hypothetical protein
MRIVKKRRLWLRRVEGGMCLKMSGECLMTLMILVMRKRIRRYLCGVGSVGGRRSGW